MKILTKRAIALLIDAFVYGLIYVLCQKLLQNWHENLSSLVYFILFVPFFFKDVIFKNASLGKKIMKIYIFNDEWQPPKAFVLVKRAFLMQTVGYVLFWRLKHFDDNMISFFDWERDSLKTRVIEKKVYIMLQKEIGIGAKDYSSKMTNRYNGYLRNLYIK